jgi:NAD(P)-dependent dehydrogenase (short-subunit alcohol dehydrogenase family)
MTDMTNNLTGSTALITGGNSGIGRAAAVALAGLGARVVLSGRDTTGGNQVVAAIRAQGGRADFAAATRTGQASARQLAKQATDLGGGHVDILVNNAGVFPFGPTHEASEADFDSASRSTSRRRSSCGLAAVLATPGRTRMVAASSGSRECH